MADLGLEADGAVGAARVALGAERACLSVYFFFNSIGVQGGGGVDGEIRLDDVYIHTWWKES